MKILITGASGFIGTKLTDILSKEYEVHGTYHQNKRDNLHFLDITDKESTYSLIEKLKPDVLIHTAAMTNVDECEKYKDSKREDNKPLKINAIGTENLMKACKESQTKMIYISTDYVFDGEKGNYDEEDETNPLSYYAKTKRMGEKIVGIVSKEFSLPCIIARIAQPYGYNNEKDKNNFFKYVYSNLGQGRKTKVFTDQFATPVLMDDISYSLMDLINTNKEGVFHVAGSERISRAEQAVKIADICNLDKNLLEYITLEEFNKTGPKAPRPKDSSLNIRKIGSLGIKMSNIEEGTIKAFEQMKK